jgi:hypothetical protein
MNLPDWEQQSDGIKSIDVTDVLYTLPLDAYIKPEQWGRDHYSLLLYCESIAVDRHGVIQLTKMRTNARTHGDLAWLPMNSTMSSHDKWGNFRYTTRARPGVEIDEDHDDWDCLCDLRQAELLSFHVLPQGQSPCKGEYVQVTLTTAGLRWAAAAREALARGATLDKLWWAGLIAETVREACART